MVTQDMVALVPQMHTFARSLCRDGVKADDLVQEALARALANIDRFRPGTNLKAWLFTIVRNEHYSQLRRRKFEAMGVDTDSLPEPSVPPDHDGDLELRDLNRALATLSPGQRTKLTVEVKDAAGKPVPNAQTAVIVVDEAVLALTGYQFPNPVD